MPPRGFRLARNEQADAPGSNGNIDDDETECAEMGQEKLVHRGRKLKYPDPYRYSPLMSCVLRLNEFGLEFVPVRPTL